MKEEINHSRASAENLPLKVPDEKDCTVSKRKTIVKEEFDYAKARAENWRRKAQTLIEAFDSRQGDDKPKVECEREEIKAEMEEIRATRRREKKMRYKQRKKERKRHDQRSLLRLDQAGRSSGVKRERDEAKAERKRVKKDAHRQKRRGKKQEWKRREAMASLDGVNGVTCRR